MEVWCEHSTGNNPRFTIFVQFDDTLERIKEKIQERTAIPVAKQTLILKEKLLTQKSMIPAIFSPSSNLNLNHLPRILIVQTYVPGDHLLRTEESHNQTPPAASPVNILMKMPVTKHWYCIQMDIVHTVRKLKEVIRHLEGIPVGRSKIHYRQEELVDEQKLFECQIFGFTRVKISCRPPDLKAPRLPPHAYGDLPPLSPKKTNVTEQLWYRIIRKQLAALQVPGPDESSSSSSSSMAKPPEDSPDLMMVYVVPFPGKEKVPVHVVAMEKAAALREECYIMYLEERIDLPEKDFTFYCGGNALDEEETLLSQEIIDGTVIDIYETHVDSDEEEEA